MAERQCKFVSDELIVPPVYTTADIELFDQNNRDQKMLV